MKKCVKYLLFTLIIWISHTLNAQLGVRGNTAIIKDMQTIQTQINAIKLIRNDDSAILFYRQVLDYAKSVAYNECTIKALNMLGERYFNKGDYASMMASYKEGISIATTKAGLHKELSKLYNGLGIAYQSIGSYDTSIACYHKSINLQDQYGSVSTKSLPYSNMGLLYLRLGRYPEAITMFKHTLHLTEPVANPYLIAVTYLNLGGTYAVMNMKHSLPLAEEYMTKALTISRNNHYPLVEHKSLYEMGVLAHNRGRPQQAIDYFEAALKIPSGSEYDDLIPRINLGNAYYKQGRFAEAQQLMEQGMRKALAMTPSPDYIVDFYLLLAEIYRIKGNYEKSAEYYSRYVELTENLRGEKLNKKIDDLRLQYETVKRDNKLITKELVIIRQQATINRNQTVTYLILAGVLILAMITWWYYRNRRIKQQQQEQKAIWTASMQGEEKERARIARELHDHIGSSLSNATMWFATIQKMNPSFQCGKEFSGALQMLKSTLTEVRNTAHNLMPELVLRQGLAEAVQNYCINVQRAANHEIKIKYLYLGYLGNIDKNIELLLYRIIQELLQNVVKHSSARNALVQLSVIEQLLSVTVEDDGKGIDILNYKTRLGTGLQNIESSITNLNGTFSIHRTKPGGTSINFEVNIKD